MQVERSRPDADELLRRVQTEEQHKARGKLKIFLGYAAGVGKTYSMLEAAGQRKAEGVDVVVGYVDTHGRVETEQMLAGLEVIPRRRTEYKGVTLEEMDIDGILARAPKLALVDELAHANVHGSRHRKRYQDVEELLSAGIDVYTTLNVQHLESMNDIVAQVTGVVVRERVPDRVLDEADEIEVIDLPPDELLQRLGEGKVYVPNQAALAVQKFFRKGNLTALREVALRRAAERVDDQMRDYMQARAIPGPWPATDRLLVCVSSNPLSERLIRTGRRLADELNAEWFVLHVEGAEGGPLTAVQRERVAQNLQLANLLGARTVTVPGRSLAEAALSYAREHNITKIIVGKPLRSRWVDLVRGSVVDQLIRHSGTIDVYVISGTSEEQIGSPRLPKVRLSDQASRYLRSLAAIGVATLLNLPLRDQLSPANLVMPYLAAVVIVALYLGRGPAIMAAVASVVLLDFFFVPPYLTFAVSDTQYLLTFLGLFVVGVVVSTLAARAAEQAEAARRREEQTASLYAFSRDLTTALNLQQTVDTVVRHLCANFGREVVVLLPEGERLKPVGAAASEQTGGEGESCRINGTGDLDDNEVAVASWVFRHGQRAGRGTDTLPASSRGYLPLKTIRGVVGVLGVRPPEPSQHLTPEQNRLIEVFADQAALAIERTQLAEQARHAQVLQAADRLQTALLNSISHDLRTPLASITGALSSLDSDGSDLDESGRKSLVQTAREEADRLNRLVGNLLEMTRLEAGGLRLRRFSLDMDELVGAALDQVAPRLGGRPVDVHIAPDTPQIFGDPALLVQVLVNLIDNANKYSPPGRAVEISAGFDANALELTVADRGIGIPPEHLDRVFDKFYRVQNPDNVAGSGLGLSISRGIVEAHGGTIEAANRSGGGTEIRITLPLVAMTDRADENSPQASA